MKLSRRTLLVNSATLALTVAGRRLFAAPRQDAPAAKPEIADPEIRAGVAAAIEKNLLPAATQEAYPGFFNISADGGAYGGSATWPGLDSWQMAGAYLLLGRTQLVLDYFEFVKASQRKSGDIPFAIFTGDTRADGSFLSGLRNPEDVFTYTPPPRDGVPASARETRRWIGLFTHWQPKAESLSTLGSVCYVLTAAEIFATTKDRAWLTARLPSLEAAARYLRGRTAENGLVARSGFYCELPPRFGFDGVAQCYVVHAWRELARLFAAADDAKAAATWNAEGDRLAKAFVAAFWRDDHFGEYVHPEHGLVDRHGLSDVNWAALAFGVADDTQAGRLWPRLLADDAFWWGRMPTLTVTKPFSYEPWENHEPVPMAVPEMNDVASMGRVWFLEALACKRMGARERLVESARRVCAAAKGDGFWRERYHPQADGTTLPAGAQKYCEYPAVLLRVVLGNPELFGTK